MHVSNTLVRVCRVISSHSVNIYMSGTMISLSTAIKLQGHGVNSLLQEVPLKHFTAARANDTTFLVLHFGEDKNPLVFWVFYFVCLPHFVLK